MNNLVYAIGDFFEATFEIISQAGNVPNVLFIVLGAAALSFCMKIVTSKKNILE